MRGEAEEARHLTLTLSPEAERGIRGPHPDPPEVGKPFAAADTTRPRLGGQCRRRLPLKRRGELEVLTLTRLRRAGPLPEGEGSGEPS